MRHAGRGERVVVGPPVRHAAGTAASGWPGTARMTHSGTMTRAGDLDPGASSAIAAAEQLPAALARAARGHRSSPPGPGADQRPPDRADGHPADRACGSRCSSRTAVAAFGIGHEAFQLTRIPAGEDDAAGTEQ